ncbi:ABC transporter ATP-binding protein [Roseivirga thermotolerans]|uniref:ABC transporter ATP-binding protein n=1 Tax=Roseivirga thermotolerans TaxID=1758176 RepID=UPI00273E8FBC|nr:ABC transporter ATP-binding protein [Roseivirga thermotolerans]
MLKITHLHKKYPGESLGAVVDVSFEMSGQEVLAIVGRSGSGKSTLLRMIAGLAKPDSGTIAFRGEPLKDPEEQLIAGHDKIKMVFQDFQVKPNMTVAENVRYKLLHFTGQFQQERTNELLEMCGLVSLASKMPHELSGGQQQRLSLARALADDPELLVMDEPFSNLDPIIKQDLLLELTDIVRKEGIGLILVSHDVQDALLIADRIAYLEDGKLLQMDSPKVIYRHPATLAIAQFFGRVNNVSALMNKKNTFVRAEDVHVHVEGASQALSITAMVQSCRFLGSRYLVTAQSGNTNLSLYHSHTLKTGQKIALRIDQSCILHFS